MWSSRSVVAGAAEAGEVVGEVEVGHGRPPQVASTRVCATTGISGVPVGTQVDWPVIVTTGAPPASTRIAPDDPLRR